MRMARSRLARTRICTFYTFVRMKSSSSTLLLLLHYIWSALCILYFSDPTNSLRAHQSYLLLVGASTARWTEAYDWFHCFFCTPSWQTHLTSGTTMEQAVKEPFSKILGGKIQKSIPFLQAKLAKMIGEKPFLLVKAKANPPSTSTLPIYLKRRWNPLFSMDTIPPSRKVNWRITGIQLKWVSRPWTKLRVNLGYYVNIHLLVCMFTFQHFIIGFWRRLGRKIHFCPVSYALGIW